MRLLLNKVLLSISVLTLSIAAFALAPVEDATQAQNVMTGELVPSERSSSQVPTGPSAERGAAPVENNAMMIAHADQAPAHKSVTDDNPLIGPGNVDKSQATTQSDDAVAPTPAAVAAPDMSFSTKSLSERVAILHQQLQNLQQENFPHQVATLQLQIQQLSGELQVAQHDIKLLNSQQRRFYQDLQNQIKHMNNISSDGGSSSEDSKSSSAKVTATPAIKSKAKSKTKVSLNDATTILDNNGSADLTATSKYKMALSELMHKRYEPSLTHFKEYLADYPKDRFVVNAHYWLGEIYVLQRNLPSAVKQFNIVVNQFPQSNKVADAKVKLAIIDASKGNTAQARRAFMKVKQQYPGTTAAQLASIQLQQLS